MHRTYDKYTGTRCNICQSPLVTNGVAIKCVCTTCKNNNPYLCGCKLNDIEVSDGR